MCVCKHGRILCVSKKEATRQGSTFVKHALHLDMRLQGRDVMNW